MDQDQLDQRVRAVLADVLSAQDRPLSSSDRQRVTQEISDDILGYGPIEPYLRDPEVSEVMVNGHASVWLEKNGKLMQADATFTDEAAKIAKAAEELTEAERKLEFAASVRKRSRRPSTRGSRWPCFKATGTHGLQQLDNLIIALTKINLGIILEQLAAARASTRATGA